MTLQLQINTPNQHARESARALRDLSSDAPRMTRRSLNWVVLLITVAVAVLCGLGLYLLHGYQLMRTAEGLLAVVDSREKDEEWLKAAESLDRYLRLKPADSGARGRMALNFGRYASSATSWMPKRQAIDLHYRALAAGNDKQEMDLRLSLMELLLDQRRFSEAEKEASRVLAKDSENPKAARALAIALSSQLADGSLTNANTKDLRLVKSIEKARKLNPHDVRLATILAVVFREYPLVIQAEYAGTSERERHQRADDSLNQLIEDNPKSALALLGRNAYRVKYGLPDARTDLDAALQLAPDDREVLLAAAGSAFDEARRVQLSGGDKRAKDEQLGRAKTHYERLLAGPPEQQMEQSYLGLGDTHFALGDLDQAIEAWETGLKRFKQPTTLIGLHARIAEAAIEHDRLSAATSALNAIDLILAKLGGSVPREDKMSLVRAQDLRRASWHVKQRNLSAAIPLLRQVIVGQARGDKDTQATFRALMHLGAINSSQGEWMDAATTFDQAGALDPGSFQPRLAAATAWLYAGRAEMASERAEQALQHTSIPEAWHALALAQLQQQSQLPPPQRSWLRLEKALSVLENAKRQLREGWRIDFLRAEFVLTKAKANNDSKQGMEEATRILRAAEAVYGREKAFWAQICIVYQSLKLGTEAERSLAELRKVEGSEADAVLVEARLASQRGEFGRAQTLLQEGLKSVPAHQQQRMREELLLAALAAKDLNQARGMLLNEYRQNPQNLGVMRRLAELDLEQRNLNGVREWEGKLQLAGPAGEQQARYFRGWRQFLSATDEKDPQLQDALRELEQVMLVRPNWAEAATLKGMVEQRLGRKEQAVAAYERAVQLGERRVLVFEQLILLLDSLKRSAEVDRYLARLEADIPLSQRLAEMAMAQQIRRDRPEQAVEIARMRAMQRPDDPLAQLWLSRLLMITGKIQEAESPLHRTTELAPSDARFWNALLDYYVRTSNREQIEKTAERLNEKAAPSGIQRSLILARCYEQLGRREEAEKQYAEAAESAPSDVTIQLRVAQFYMQRNPQQAKKCLEVALKLDPASVSAKQMLAIVHAALGELSETEALLSVAAEDGTIAADDVRLNALLLLQRGGEANLGMAVGKLEELLNRDSLSAREQATDRLLVARLYEQQARLTRESHVRDERLQRAEQQITSVAQQSDAAPAHLAALIQFLIRHQRRDEATTWLDRLETQVQAMPKEDASVLALVIQLQLQHESPRRTEKWIAKLESVDPTPLRPLVLKAQAAFNLDNKADMAGLIEPKATNLEAAAKSPEQKAQLAAAVGDLYFGFKRDADAERWYRKALSQDPKRYPSVVKAVQRQGRIKDSIAVCEQAIHTDQTVQPYLLLASVLIEGKPTPAHFEAAESMFRAAINTYESDPRLLYALGLVRVMQKRDADSIILFRKVVAASPRSTAALNNLAMLLADIPVERPEALKLIDQAIDFAGEDASLLDTKGAILLYSGRSAEAVPLLELATREPTADPRHHFHLALAYRDQGKIDLAKRQLQTALDRELVSQVLTNTDQQLLAEIRTALKL